MQDQSKSMVEAQLVLRELHQLLEVTETALCEYIQNKERPLTEADVKKVVAGLKEQPELFPTKVKRALHIDQIQKFGRDAFSRVLVERFEKLIYEPSGRTLQQGALPRWMIPGFLECIRLLIGVQAYRDCREQCSHIVERLHENRDDLIDPEFWRRFYSDAEAMLLADKVYAQVATHFANYEKRKKWFLNIVNEYVESDNRERPPAKQHKWRMKEHHFIEMFTRIYVDDVKKMSPRGPLKQAMTQHHGPGGVERFEKMLAALKLDVKRVLSQNRAIT